VPGRLIKTSWSTENLSGRDDILVRYHGKGISVSGQDLDHALGLL
jgi:hypothetical protein